jgi:hypothetical protein
VCKVNRSHCTCIGAVRQRCSKRSHVACMRTWPCVVVAARGWASLPAYTTSLALQQQGRYVVLSLHPIMLCRVTCCCCFLHASHGKWCGKGAVSSEGMHLYGCMRYSEALQFAA